MSHPHPKALLAVGSLAFDSIQAPAGKVDHVLGGSANYFSIASSFYTPTEIVGVVGEDFPPAHLEWLASRKIDVSGVQIARGKTFHWVGSYSHDLNEAQTLSTALNVFEHFDPVLSERHKQAPYVFLANIDPVLQQRVLEQISDPRLVALDSMNFWITGKPDELKKALSKIDILSVNSGESYLLTGEKNICLAAAKIQEMGPKVVIIKRGEYGAMLFSGKKVFIAPAFPVEAVVDPTGAGDTFAGAFMGYLAEAHVHRNWMQSDPQKWEHALRHAVIAGCVMASFTVEDFSFHRLAKLHHHELVKRQSQLVSMMSL